MENRRYLWTNDDQCCSTLLLDEEPIAHVYEHDDTFYGNCYIFDDFETDGFAANVLGAKSLNYAKNEMLNKIRKHIQAKINEYLQLKVTFKKGL